MGDASSCPPLTRESVQAAHAAIKKHIHRTPTITCDTISLLASTPQTSESLQGTPFAGRTPSSPRINLFFKCENYQKIGAFKARGAFHALSRLTQEELSKGVVTHSSGNHAQALALAARTHGIPAHIVMPTISTPSKIAATKGYGANVIFSGSTSDEREAVVADVIRDTGAILVPPYDHPNIMLGQGTLALELEEQAKDLDERGLDAVVAPCGGGGMLSGVATALYGTGIRVFGSEPSFEGADDAKRGVESGTRVEKVKTLTIADGLRTPLGKIPWTIISDKEKVKGMYSVTEDQIKSAMRLLLERAKVFVEPSAAVPLAVVLYDEDFRSMVEKEGGEQGWNIGIVLSGGNTTVEAIAKLFEPASEQQAERQASKLGMNGERVAENVAG
jgi:threonine dehydratase